MQISRRILLASVTATLLFPFALSAQDANADDVKLLEALKQKMKDLGSAPPATQPPPTAPQQPANVAPAATKPAAPAMAPVAAPAEATNPQDDAKMQDALHRKINELDAEQPATPVVPPPPVAASKSKSEPLYQPLPGSNPPPAAVTHSAKAEPTTPAAQQASRDAEIAKAVADANARQAKDNQVPKADTTMTKPNQKSVAAARTTSTLPPFQAPASSLNSSQQARLQALDQQYMSDLVTSEQYHARRAKIIAEP
jgi:hypothetical protein